jgi:hypothetical protein
MTSPIDPARRAALQRIAVMERGKERATQFKTRKEWLASLKK